MSGTNGAAARVSSEGESAADLIDLTDAGRVLRHGWRRIVLATGLGGLAAAAVLLWAPRRFEGASTVLVRSAADAGSSLLGRLGIPADLAPASLGGALKSPLETELQILGSQSVIGAVSDSLGLQIRVLAPRGAAPWRLLRPTPHDGSFRKRTVDFVREGGSYRVHGDGITGVVSQSRPLETAFGRFVLADGVLPESFSVQLLDREDGLTRLTEHLDVAKAGGEVVRVGYAAADSLSAGAVPDALVRNYLARRRTTDRGVNQYRVEFLAAQLDSAGGQLAAAERALRGFQEGQGGAVDPQLVGKLEVEGASKVRELLAANEVESTALDTLLRQVSEGRATARQLAGYPTLLRSPAINEIVALLARNEADRTLLLERRTPADPEVVALSQSIAGLERQIEPVSRAYATALGRQRAELRRQSAGFDAEIARLPAAAQAYVRLERDVKRLSQTALALQTQLLEARLAAVSEGGDARILDRSVVPKRVAFPRPLPTLAIGLGGGLVTGVLFVALAGFLSPRLSGPADAARAGGLPAALLGQGSALFHASVRAEAGLAVAPLSADVDAAAVAAWLTPRVAAATLPPRLLAAHRARAWSGEDGRTLLDLGEGDADQSDTAARAVTTTALPPLDTPEGAAAVSRAERVVLAVPRNAFRRDVADAVAAIRAGGAEPVAIVVA